MNKEKQIESGKFTKIKVFLIAQLWLKNMSFRESENVVRKWEIPFIWVVQK